jgi:hypothetical protein
VFTIQRAGPGRKVGRRCVKPTTRNRRARRCTRFTAVGRFAVTSRAGANSHRFSGKIGRRKLTTGRYRALLIATDAAGNHSRPRQITFTIVPG